jgi:hypothetical protein
MNSKRTILILTKCPLKTNKFVHNSLDLEMTLLSLTEPHEVSSHHYTSCNRNCQLRNPRTLSTEKKSPLSHYRSRIEIPFYTLSLYNGHN